MAESTSPCRWYVGSWKTGAGDGESQSYGLHWTAGSAPNPIAFLAVASADNEDPGGDRAARRACREVHRTVLSFLKRRPDPSDLAGIASAAEARLPDLLLEASGGVDLVSVTVTDVFALYVQLGAGDLVTVADEGAVRRPMESAQSAGISPGTRPCRIRFEPFRDSPPALILASTADASTPLSQDDAPRLVRRARREGLDAIGQELGGLFAGVEGVVLGAIARSVPAEEEAVATPIVESERSVAAPPPSRPSGKLVLARRDRSLAFEEPEEENFDLSPFATGRRRPLVFRRSRLVLWALLAALLVVGIYLVVASLRSDVGPRPADPEVARHPIYRLAVEALENGQIASPPGRSAISYFELMSKEDPDSDVVREVGQRIAAAARPIGDDVFHRFYTESDQEIDWPAILNIYEFLAEIEPGNPDHQGKAAYCRAHLAFEKKDYLVALSGYREALKYKPDWALAINGIAKAHVRKDSPVYDREKARRYYKEVAEKDPRFVFAILNLARMDIDEAEEEKDFRKWLSAESYLTQALALDSDRASIYRSMAIVQEKLGKRSLAIRYYKDSIGYEDNADINKWVIGEIARLERKR